MTTKIEDLAETINSLLLDYADQATVAMQEAVDEVAKDIQSNVKKNAGAAFKRSGSYAKSWSVKRITEKNGTYRAVVYSKGYPLAHLLENGHKVANQAGKWTSKWKGTGYVPGVVHVATAAESGEELLVRLIAEKMEKTT